MPNADLVRPDSADDAGFISAAAERRLHGLRFIERFIRRNLDRPRAPVMRCGAFRRRAPRGACRRVRRGARRATRCDVARRPGLYGSRSRCCNARWGWPRVRTRIASPQLRRTRIEHRVSGRPRGWCHIIGVVGRPEHDVSGRNSPCDADWGRAASRPHWRASGGGQS